MKVFFELCEFRKVGTSHGRNKYKYVPVLEGELTVDTFDDGKQPAYEKAMEYLKGAFSEEFWEIESNAEWDDVFTYDSILYINANMNGEYTSSQVGFKLHLSKGQWR